MNRRPPFLAVVASLLTAATAPVIAAEQEVLAPAKQKAIWDAEHATFEIETHFGKRFLTAYRQRDPKALAALMRGDFTGAVLPETIEPIQRRKGLVAELSRSATDATRSATDAGGVASALLAPLRSFASIDSARLRVLHISAQIPADQKGQQWATTVLLTAGGQGGDGELLAIDSLHEAVFQAASDADYKTAPAVRSWRVSSERSRTAERLLMGEVTLAAGLHRIPVSDNWKLPPDQPAQRFNFQFAVEDFDRDGFLDIALASVRGPTALLKSLGGKRFTVANRAVGVPMMATEAQRALACWLDFDNDGYPDLILGNRVYRNREGKRFEEITAESGLKFPASPNGCAVADYDGDGFCDLYVLYQGAADLDENGDPLPWVGDDISGAENTLWRSLGDGRFEDVTAKSKAGGGKRNSFAATWLFADGDALPDLYIANDFGSNNLLRNRGDGSFEEISAQTGAADFATSMGVTSGDLDNDGSPEIYVANMYSKMGRRIIGQVSEKDYEPGTYQQIKGACAGNRLYKRGVAGGRYGEWSEPWGINDIGWAYAPAMADLDNDGLLDLYATTGFLSFERGKPDG